MKTSTHSQIKSKVQKKSPKRYQTRQEVKKMAKAIKELNIHNSNMSGINIFLYKPILLKPLLWD